MGGGNYGSNPVVSSHPTHLQSFLDVFGSIVKAWKKVIVGIYHCTAIRSNEVIYYQYALGINPCFMDCFYITHTRFSPLVLTVGRQSAAKGRTATTTGASFGNDWLSIHGEGAFCFFIVELNRQLWYVILVL
jgi:hypothetical protein